MSTCGRSEGARALRRLGAWLARRGAGQALPSTPARAALRSFAEPPVVKASGLAAGKGVTVAESFAEAELALRSCLEGQAFGAAGEVVVLEERMRGEEASLFVISDGEVWNLDSAAFLTRCARERVRVFAVAVGSAAVESTFAPLTRATGGALERVLPSDAMAERIARHFSRARCGALRELVVVVEADELGVRAAERAAEHRGHDADARRRGDTEFANRLLSLTHEAPAHPAPGQRPVSAAGSPGRGLRHRAGAVCPAGS